MDLTQAFVFASESHKNQHKKGTSIPFLYHPMAVASLVLKYGGNEAQALAALLHDTIADGKVSEAEISSRFGAEVSRVVFGFADPELPSNGSTSWQVSKKAYLQKLSTLDEATLFVVACEELHDGTELLHDLKYQGASVWKRYSVHGMELFWYFRELLVLFNSTLKKDQSRALLGEFAAFVRSLKGVTMEGSSY